MLSPPTPSSASEGRLGFKVANTRGSFRVGVPSGSPPAMTTSGAKPSVQGKRVVESGTKGVRMATPILLCP